MKTAVEWLIEQWPILESQLPQQLIQQAKAMEKEQIGKAFFQGRLKEIGSNVLFDLQPLIDTYNDYYNKTFKSEQNETTGLFIYNFNFNNVWKTRLNA